MQLQLEGEYCDLCDYAANAVCNTKPYWEPGVSLFCLLVSYWTLATAVLGTTARPGGVPDSKTHLENKLRDRRV